MADEKIIFSMAGVSKGLPAAKNSLILAYYEPIFGVKKCISPATLTV